VNQIKSYDAMKFLIVFMNLSLSMDFLKIFSELIPVWHQPIFSFIEFNPNGLLRVEVYLYG